MSERDDFEIEEVDDAGVDSGPILTGIAGSDAERRAARALARELGDRGREVQVDPISVRLSRTSDLVIHCLLAVGAGLLGLAVPLLGATLVLLVAFSFYSGRALGFPVLSRLVPKRATQNVLSPKPGPAWVPVEVVVCCGLDLVETETPDDWLEGRLRGRLTAARIAFWFGMVPLFPAMMLLASGIEGFLPGVIQFLASTVLLGIVAIKADRWLAGRGPGTEAPARAADMVLDVLDEISGDPDREPPVGIAFFGAESRDAAGAASFLREIAPTRDGRPVLINLIDGGAVGGRQGIGGTGPLVTAREGDLSVLVMDDELAPDGRSSPRRAILRRLTAAGVARRRGMRGCSLIGTDDSVVDLALDVIGKATDGDGP